MNESDTAAVRAVGTLGILLYGVALLCATTAQDRGTVVQADICTLSAHPGKFRNRLVRFHAHLYFGVDNASLSDKSSKCFVIPWIPSAVQDDPDIHKARIEAMGAFNDVSGTITGEFFVGRGRHGPIGIVDVIKITDLKVVPVKAAQPKQER